MNEMSGIDQFAAFERVTDHVDRRAEAQIGLFADRFQSGDGQQRVRPEQLSSAPSSETA